MALGDILKEFLVRIGYTIDKSSERQFLDSIKSATAAVTGMGAAIEATAGAVVFGLQRMSEAMEQFYFMSQRTGATIEGIKALSFAGRQLGVSAGEMQGSIEGLGQFLRNNPLAKSFIEGRLGVKTTDAQGKQRDTASIMGDLGKSFANMPLYLANAYASALGISERTVLAMRQGMGDYIREYQGMLKRLGVDEEAAGKASHAFMVQIRDLESIMGALGDKILQLLGPRVSAGISNFRSSIEKNFDRISRAIAHAIELILQAADVVDHLVVRAVQGLAELYDAFENLPKSVQYAIEAIAGLLIAFTTLNPVTTLLLGLGAAILLIYDDYKTWKEGGKHFIDWDVWEPEIKGAIQGFKHIYHSIDTLTQALTGQSGLQVALETLLIFMTGRFVIGMVGAFRTIAMNPYLAAITAAVLAAEKLASFAHGFDEEHQWARDLDDNVRNWMRSKLGLTPKAADQSDNPDAMTHSGAQLPSNGNEAFAFWKSKGFSDAGAAAMVAQEQHESGFNPNAVGDGGQAYGLFQWHGDRRMRISKATGIDISTADANTQREAMYQEMKRGLDPQSGQAFDAIKNAVDPQVAAKLGVHMIERPADLATNDRVRSSTAQVWYNYLHGKSGGSSVTANQNNTFHIQGGNPDQIAQQVKGAVTSTQAQLTRNLTGAAM